MDRTQPTESAPSASILVGTDLSPRVTSSYPTLRNLAKHLEAKVHFLHVYTPVPAPSVDAAERALSELGRSEGLHKVEKHLKIDTRWFEEEDLHASWSIHQAGPPARALLDWAHDNEPDLIVLPTDESETMLDRLKGTVTTGVLEEADRPVLTIAPSQAQSATPWQNVLAPVDFSQQSANALSAALRFIPAGARVDLLYVVPQTFPVYHGARGLGSDFYRPEELEEGFEGDVERFWKRFGRDDLDMKIHKVEGKTEDAIVAASEKFDADVLIMPVERTGLFRDLGAKLANRPESCAILSVPVSEEYVRTAVLDRAAVPAGVA